MIRLRGEEALRAELLHQILGASLAAAFVYIVLAASTRLRSLFFPWDCVELLAAIGLAAWLLQARRISTATAFLIAILSHPLAFLIATFGFDGPTPALLVPTIVICGLLIGRRFVLGWVAICSGILVFDALVRRELLSPHFAFLLFWCATYLTVGWLVMLFSQHLERLLATAQEVEEAERSAIVAERTRLARDIHDTLAQGFTGIILQMNAAEEVLLRDPLRVQSHLERARTLARESLAETRRSVWALRSSDPGADLLAELERMAGRILEGSPLRMTAAAQGESRPLPEPVRSNLLRITQEAVTNAVRHAGATLVQLQLTYAPGEVRLEIRDDGGGWSEAGPGGLGLQGMAERAGQIRGKLEIITRPGEGATIRAIVPVP